MPSIRVILEAYKNFPLAEWCVRCVRAAYPEARITVISDGDIDPKYGAVGAHGAEIVYGERLWTTGKAGALWKRRLLMFSEAPADYLFKIDTDTGFYRPLREIPTGRCLFGSVIGDGETSFIQGGFIGMPRDVAVETLTSGFLDHQKVAEFNVKNYDSSSEISADDRALSYVARKLGVPLVDHKEINCRWKIRAENKDLHYAVVHPCKDGKL